MLDTIKKLWAGFKVNPWYVQFSIIMTLAVVLWFMHPLIVILGTWVFNIFLFLLGSAIVLIASLIIYIKFTEDKSF